MLAVFCIYTFHFHQVSCCSIETRLYQRQFHGTKINRHYYREVSLMQELPPVICSIAADVFVFKQDNAPTHRAHDMCEVLCNETPIHSGRPAYSRCGHYILLLFLLSFFMAALYEIGQDIYIFIRCFFFFFLFPHLISVVGDWMSTMLPHIVWS